MMTMMLTIIIMITNAKKTERREKNTEREQLKKL